MPPLPSEIEVKDSQQHANHAERQFSPTSETVMGLYQRLRSVVGEYASSKSQNSNLPPLELFDASPGAQENHVARLGRFTNPEPKKEENDSPTKQLDRMTGRDSSSVPRGSTPERVTYTKDAQYNADGSPSSMQVQHDDGTIEFVRYNPPSTVDGILRSTPAEQTVISPNGSSEYRQFSQDGTVELIQQSNPNGSVSTFVRQDDGTYHGTTRSSEGVVTEGSFDLSTIDRRRNEEQSQSDDKYKEKMNDRSAHDEHRNQQNQQSDPSQQRGDGGSQQRDLVGPTDEGKARDQPEQLLSPEAVRDRRLVEQMRERGATPEELTRFTNDLAALRQRRDLTPQEVSRTLDHVERLMASQGDDPVDQTERRRISMQIVAHAAHPSDIDQGNHNTCNVTTVEERMFTRNPSQAAEMIATAAITGAWTAPDGRRIRLDPTGISFVPGREERNTYPGDGQRSHASQIFQHVAVNDVLQRRDPPEFYRQDLTPTSSSDTGERLYTADNQPIMRNGVRATSPGLTASDMADLGRRLTGDNGYVLVGAGTHTGDNARAVGTEQELIDTVRDLQRRGQLPATIMVDANHPAFRGSGAPGDSPRWHVVSITDYNETTGFFVSNQWGSQYDRRMTPGELFGSTREWRR